MQTFYFNVRGKSVVYEDFEGARLPGRTEAWHWAVTDARRLIDQGAVEGNPQDYWIEIVNEHRQPVATVPLERLARQK